MRKIAGRSALVLTVMFAVAVSTAVNRGSTQTLKPNAKESHLKNIRQLTHGGTNAEAYFSADGKKLIFQSTRDPYKCDQIFSMKSDGSNLKLVSTGKGRTTCSYFTPDGKRIIYASTHLGSPDCPPAADRSAGYVWALYSTFDIFSAKPDGTDMKRLTTVNGYDAEGTVSPDGKKIIFTSTRDGDIELYEMNIDGSNQRRLTREVGYDGGAFYSQDNQWIVWRANRPKTAADLRTYQELLSKDLVMPTKMEIMIMKADGTQMKQLTSNGAANFAPYFVPNGKQIIFSSDMNNKSPGIPNFDLYLINRDGSGLEQITWDEGFDAFPMFSNDGKKVVWASSRNGAKEGDIDIFIADWVE
jgi:Tol biopolymer transport system component